MKPLISGRLPMQPSTPRRPLKVMRILTRAVLYLSIAAALLFAGDYGWVRVRLANHEDPRSSMQVRSLLAVPQKNGRMEYIPGDAETRVCVASLFPQLGAEPCWYLRRHTRRVVEY